MRHNIQQAGRQAKGNVDSRMPMHRLWSFLADTVACQVSSVVVSGPTVATTRNARSKLNQVHVSRESRTQRNRDYSGWPGLGGSSPDLHSTLLYLSMRVLTLSIPALPPANQTVPG